MKNSGSHTFTHPIRHVNIFVVRIARKGIHREFLRDSLDDDDLTSPEISLQELEIDKALLRLIMAACKENNVLRAVDIVQQLNHRESFDGASQIAMFFGLIGLEEKIQSLKSENGDRLEKQRQERRRRAAQLAPKPSSCLKKQIIPPDPNNPRLLEDFRPPLAIYRPGLAPAIPFIQTSKYSRANLDAEEKRRRDELNHNALDPTHAAPTPRPYIHNNPFRKKIGPEPHKASIDSFVDSHSESAKGTSVC